MPKRKRKAPPRPGGKAPPKRKPRPKRKLRPFPTPGSSKQPDLSTIPQLVVERHSIGGEHTRVTMQLEWINCGRCPKAHGPYWYAYRRRRVGGMAGALVKVYVGKKRSDAKAIARLRERGAL